MTGNYCECDSGDLVSECGCRHFLLQKIDKLESEIKLLQIEMFPFQWGEYESLFPTHDGYLDFPCVVILLEQVRDIFDLS